MYGCLHALHALPALLSAYLHASVCDIIQPLHLTRLTYARDICHRRYFTLAPNTKARQGTSESGDKLSELMTPCAGRHLHKRAATHSVTSVWRCPRNGKSNMKQQQSELVWTYLEDWDFITAESCWEFSETQKELALWPWKIHKCLRMQGSSATLSEVAWCAPSTSCWNREVHARGCGSM